MNQTFIKPADNFSRAFSRELTETLPYDILVLIFQIVVDEDAVHTLTYPSASRIETPVSVRFALVNRRWKDIVYGTPSLWPIVEVILSQPARRAQSRLDHLTALAKNSPVDLYLHKVHSHKYGSFRHTIGGYCDINDPTTCACYGERLALSLQGITNLRSLTIMLWNASAGLIVGPEFLPSLSNVRHLRYQISFPDQVQSHKLQLWPLFSDMSNLIELKIDLVDTIVLPIPKPPLLPNLHTLDVNSPPNIPRRLFLSLLLHCPNIKKLHIGLWNGGTENSGPTTHPTITLHQLKKLHISNTGITRRMFINGLVKTLVLEELHHEYWDDVHFEELQGFLRSSITLRKLTTWVNDASQYDRGLREVPNLEDLTLYAQQNSTGEWLNLLCPPDVNFSKPTHHLTICPNLHRIRFQLAGDLSQHYFERFAHARCIPINEERVTKAGFRAVDSIVFQFYQLPQVEKIMAQLRECACWKEAVVRQLSPREYQVHYKFFRSESSSSVL